MSFAETIQTIPFNPRQPQATGILAPFNRASGHVLYLLGCLADDTQTVAEEDALAELNHAQEHLDARQRTANLSAQAEAHLTALNTATAQLREEFTNWDDETKIRNTRDLAQRFIGISAFLDRELVGLPGSDPGSTL